MFFFLSKVIPLLFYPIGLSCLLLVLAIVLIWRRRSRLALLPISAALVVILLSSNPIVSGQLVRSLEWQTLPRELPQADAIVVLGGCTESRLPPRPWVEVNEAGDRVLYAAELYRQGKAPKVILSGGRMPWFGQGLSESGDMAELLKTMGVPATAILQDPDSQNTRENAVNVQKIMAAQGMKQVLLVTSAIHMPRSRLIFKKLGVNAIPAPTDFLAVQPTHITSEGFVIASLPDAEPLRNTTRVIKEYVGIVIYWLQGWA
jgi:uncharacterized SAM-binding protein YcdF (DUF218 family)